MLTSGDIMPGRKEKVRVRETVVVVRRNLINQRVDRWSGETEWLGGWALGLARWMRKLGRLLAMLLRF